MFAILFSWIIIGFILFTFGDGLANIFSKVCKREEQYNLLDKILLGLCFLIIPLSIWSLWLPSDQIFLFTSLVLSVGYWIIFRKRFHEILSNIKKITSRLSSLQLILILLFALVSVYMFTWEQEVYDSLYYHHQNIRWNEEFAVVPGLGNVDDRFGFNSNYFLLSAIFTFRFLFGEAIYPLQSFIVTLIGCWIFYEVFRSNYDLKRVIILISYILSYWVSIYFLGNTSTDILPNFIVFYIVARLVLYPTLLKSNYLIGIIVPVFLLTCKLSFFPICFISLYLLYLLIKNKEYKALSFVLVLCSLIVIPWLIRNVIISGYLIYPLYQIDLFSFDWKIPQEVAIKQKDYIFAIGYYFFRIAVRYPHMSNRDPLAINILTDVIYLLTFVAMIVITYYVIKNRKELKQSIILLYIIFLISLLVWITGGPDIRFVSGILCAIIFVGAILFVKNKEFPALGKITTCLFVISILIWGSSRFYKLYTETDNHKIISHIIYRPYSVKDQLIAKDIIIEKDFRPYSLNNNISILVNSDLSYDIFPSTIHSHYSKFLPIDCLEARGNSLQDGFRAKENCR